MGAERAVDTKAMKGSKGTGNAPTRVFRPYTEYKDSGDGWLGEIPAHWSLKRLKSIATINAESLPEDHNPQRNILYVDISNVDSVKGILQKEEVAFENAPSRARRVVRDGDVIVSTVRTYLRAIAEIRNPEPNLIVSTGFAVVRPKAVMSGSFGAYALRAPYFVEQIVAGSVGVSFPAINASEIGCLSIALPPLHEQFKIAEFLDREVAEIDTLLEKKRHLVALLEEKRSALITKTVTKGLDPSVALSNSGIEWLGLVPTHWKLMPLGQALSKITYGFTNPMPAADDGPYMLTANDIAAGEILWEQARRTTEEAFLRDLTEKSKPLAGDILLTKDGTLGRVAISDGRH